MARTKEEMAKYNQEYRKRKLEEDPDFFKKYKGRDKESQAQYNREYKKRKLEEDPDFFKKQQARWRNENKERYEETRQAYLKRNSEKLAANRQERRLLLHKIKLTYGCCNPDCRWSGDIDPCALDFHHLDSASKEQCVAAYVTHRLSSLVEEVRKCTVLCAICHRLESFGFVDAKTFERCNVDEHGAVIAKGLLL